MASSEIRAPQGLWMIATMLVFVGFYEFSIGFNALLNSLVIARFVILKLAAGFYFLFAGIALAFTTMTGKFMVIFGCGVGIIICFMRHGWVQFLLSAKPVSYSFSAPKTHLLPGILVCLAIILYIFMSTDATSAFHRKKNIKRMRFDEETLF